MARNPSRRNRHRLLVKLVQQLEHLLIERNVAHRFSVMLETNLAVLVHDDERRHPSQLEQVHFLVVSIRHLVLWIGQSRERKRFLFPRALKGSWAIRPDDEHLGIACDELIVILAQLRQMPAAVGSRKAACKDEHGMFLAAIIGQSDVAPTGIWKDKIRRDKSFTLRHC